MVRRLTVHKTSTACSPQLPGALLCSISRTAPEGPLPAAVESALLPSQSPQVILGEALKVASNAPKSSQARRRPLTLALAAAAFARVPSVLRLPASLPGCSRPFSCPERFPTIVRPIRPQWDFRELYRQTDHKDHPFWKVHPQDEETLGFPIYVRCAKHSIRLAESVTLCSRSRLVMRPCACSAALSRTPFSAGPFASLSPPCPPPPRPADKHQQEPARLLPEHNLPGLRPGGVRALRHLPSVHAPGRDRNQLRRHLRASRLEILRRERPLREARVRPAVAVGARRARPVRVAHARGAPLAQDREVLRAE